MDRISRLRCNGHTVSFPRIFRVRKYNGSLNYRTHSVIRYETSHPTVYTYQMSRSTERVSVRVTDSDIVAENDRLGAYKYMHFPASTPIANIVCEMLTKSDSLVVLDDSTDSIEQTLF